ncbi:Ger(x)C family spore germination protein [Pseudalkalibacillus caeni]|uniref:Ger(X)C family spore germination protein n=1 Tax=Exobacillus caeni TaxID=2574798 RepID=A0A5R9FF04_9BACL|nr:Ger(x)C family spore germination protein [Pseudalkalibacillus caeni]TLS38155.1 Ger(x)C family spore germination protein [Pseudalkalibacillus caeni]
MKRKWLIPIVILLLFLSGCGNEVEIIDDISLVTVVGYDKGEDGKLIGTVSIPIYNPDFSINTEQYTSQAHLINENRDKLNAQSSKPLVSGKLLVALYSKELAREGLADLLDNLRRDPSIAANVYLAIVDGNVKELMDKQYSNVDLGIFLSRLIEQNIKTESLPKTNLHLFLNDYLEEGKDPFLPIIKKRKDTVEITQLGLFKGDNYVEAINYKAGFMFKGLSGNFKNASYTLKFKKDAYVFIQNLKSKRKVEVKHPDGRPQITVNLNLNGIIKEYNRTKVTGKNIVTDIEKKMEKEIQVKAEELIRRCQELGVDSFGIGEKVRQHSRSWTKEEWQTIYPELDIKVSVKVDIQESGVTK